MAVQYPVAPRLQLITVTDRNAKDIVKAIEPFIIDRQIDLTLYLEERVHEARMKGQDLMIEFNWFARKWHHDVKMKEAAEILAQSPEVQASRGVG